MRGIQRRLRRRRTRSEWEELISKQDRSELSLRAFCERHDVALSTFEHWRRKTQEPAPRFIEMTVEPASPGDDHTNCFDVEVELPHGIRIRVGGRASIERVRDLVTALKETRQPC